jgi:hypothetical protein
VLSWEIFGDDLLWFEIYAGLLLLIATAVWVFVPKFPVGLAALALTLATLAAGAFRPYTYNSDTSNYYSYVYFLRFITGSEIFFITKLEPVHSGLILILRDFRLWLIAESALQAYGLVLCYKVKPNLHSFILLCAYVLTLSTSSLRFCCALIYFFYFISKQDVSPIRAIRVTIILTLFHISMLLSGALSLQRRIAPIAVTLLCAAIFFQNSLLFGWKVDVDYSEASRGLKTLTVAIVPLLYLVFRQHIGKSLYLGLYLVALLSLFLISSTVLPTFNRFMILGALVIMIKQWNTVRKGEDDVFDRAVLLLMSSGVVVAYVWGLPALYYRGEW